ncbi:hypothetical protein BJX70DRAFT_177155 [Aspergillus crustosus]
MKVRRKEPWTVVCVDDCIKLWSERRGGAIPPPWGDTGGALRGGQPGVEFFALQHLICCFPGFLPSSIPIPPPEASVKNKRANQDDVRIAIPALSRRVPLPECCSFSASFLQTLDFRSGFRISDSQGHGKRGSGAFFEEYLSTLQLAGTSRWHRVSKIIIIDSARNNARGCQVRRA